jgi:predicted nucleic-acid-binding protein
METYLIDANFLLRFLLRDDEYQFTQTVKYISFGKNNKVKLLLPAIIVAEVIYVLENKYKFSRSEIVEKMGVIINTPYIDLGERQYIKQALLTYFENKIHFADCYLIEKAISDNCKILTFDKALIKHYNKISEEK